MSGFFSLGQKDNQEQDQQAEIYNKGFQLWQHYYQSHQQRPQDAGFPIGPSSVAPGPSKGDEPSNYSYRSEELGFREMNQGRSGNEITISCQDCGNQAKKDCEHMRCRTCCKSRGFPCQTHVKSTWVSALKRREKQHQTTRGETLKRLRDGGGSGGGSGSGGGGGGGFEMSTQFPPEVNSPAVFRCVRVSAMDEAEESLAYQTAVNIGGHVFKGILYDQGPESRYPGGGGGGGGEGTSGGGGSQPYPLDLIAAAPATTTSAATTSNMNVTMQLDPSTIYPSPFTGFMSGTQFFLPPRN